MTEGIVQIPSDHFVKSVRIQYSQPEEALIRELLQNSIDAKASHIQFFTTEDSLLVEDDGKGMSKDIMINAMLTFGGSFKDEDSIGGFGLAKEIILFQHESYEIITRDMVVTGSTLNYNIREGNPHFQGTKITMKFHKLFEYKQSRIESIILNIARKSRLNCRVSLNNVEILNFKPNRRKIKDIEWGKVYLTKTENIEYDLLVLYKGLFMFSIYVGKINKKLCQVELVGKCREILTGTRDGLIDSKRRELQEMANALVVDNKSFGDKVDKTIIFRGKNNASYPADLQFIEEKIRELCSLLTSNTDLSTLTFTTAENSIPDTTRAVLMSQIAGLIENLPTEESKARLQLLVEKAQAAFNSPSEQDATPKLILEECIEEINNLLSADFLVMLDGEQYRKTPTALLPTRLKGRNLWLAKAWKTCIGLVLKANNRTGPFRIGWVLHPEKEACYAKEDNINGFLLNPLMDPYSKDKSKEEILRSLWAAACHEIAHENVDYHNEDYARELTTILGRGLKEYPTMPKLKRLIKAEEI